MTMLDPIQDDGDTVMATKSQQEGQDGTSLQAGNTAAGNAATGNAATGKAATGKAATGTAATSQSADAPLVAPLEGALVERQASPRRRTKMSPTAQYDTDRYRLARPFTTRL